MASGDEKTYFVQTDSDHDYEDPDNINEQCGLSPPVRERPSYNRQHGQFGHAAGIGGYSARDHHGFDVVRSLDGLSISSRKSDDRYHRVHGNKPDNEEDTEDDEGDDYYEEIPLRGRRVMRHSIYNVPREQQLQPTVSSSGMPYDVPPYAQPKVVTVRSTTYAPIKKRARVPRVLVKMPGSSSEGPLVRMVNRPLPEVPGRSSTMGYENASVERNNPTSHNSSPDMDVRSPRPNRRMLSQSSAYTTDDDEPGSRRDQGRTCPTNTMTLSGQGSLDMRSPDGTKKKGSAFKKIRGSFGKLMSAHRSTTPSKSQQSNVSDTGTLPRLMFSFMSRMTHELPIGPTKDAHVLYFEGGIAVGKTTTILEAGSFWNNILQVMEPLSYWTALFEKNVCSQIYDLIKNKERGARVSGKVLSCQMVFSHPFRATQHALEKTCVRTLPDSEPCNNFVLIDRHLLSATVLFPFIFNRLGILTFSDLLSLLATFSANVFDNVLLFKLNPHIAYGRIKERGREAESSIKKSYLVAVNDAIEMLYTTWELLKILSPEAIVEAVLSRQPIKKILQGYGFPVPRAQLLAGMIMDSMFGAIKHDLAMTELPDMTLPHILHKFCYELSKIQIYLLDAGEFSNDVPGLWKHIYTRILTDSAIKTCTLKWDTLTKGLTLPTNQ